MVCHTTSLCQFIEEVGVAFVALLCVRECVLGYQWVTVLEMFIVCLSLLSSFHLVSDPLAFIHTQKLNSIITLNISVCSPMLCGCFNGEKMN